MRIMVRVRLQRRICFLRTLIRRRVAARRHLRKPKGPSLRSRPIDSRRAGESRSGSADGRYDAVNTSPALSAPAGGQPTAERSDIEAPDTQETLVVLSSDPEDYIIDPDSPCPSEDYIIDVRASTPGGEEDPLVTAVHRQVCEAMRVPIIRTQGALARRRADMLVCNARQALRKVAETRRALRTAGHPIGRAATLPAHAVVRSARNQERILVFRGALRDMITARRTARDTPRTAHHFT